MRNFVKIAGLILLFMIFLSVETNAQNKNAMERSITKTFQVSNGARLNVDNVYGNINLQSWNKNEIQAVIKIKGISGNDEDTRQLINEVAIQSNQSDGVVSIKTIYTSGNNSSFWKKFFNSSSRGNRSIQINYEVYVPQSLASIDIKNKYGGVTGNQLPGDLNLNIDYGAFNIKDLAGRLNLNTSYCKGSLTGIKSGTVTVNYTDFNMDKVNNLQVNSIYSDYKISQADNLNISSTYSDITADNIGSLQGKSTYSDYKINSLTTQGTIATVYGDITIKALGSQFKTLTITPANSDISVGIPDGLPLQLDIKLVYGDIKTGGIPLQVTQKSETGNTSILQATSGGGKDGAVIKINGTYADVNLHRK